MTPVFPAWSRDFQDAYRNFQSTAASGLQQLEALFGAWISSHHLAPTDSGPLSRRRRWTLRLLFWTFLWQVAQAGAACREAIRQAQSFCQLNQQPVPPDEDSPYCQARAKLPIDVLDTLHRRVVADAETTAPRGRLWLGHRVLAVDGTCLSAPDTEANQKAFPQSNSQKAGCGFPLIRLVVLFSLATGMIVAWATGTWYQNELRLLASLWEQLLPGDVLLGDRGFGNWSVLAQCVQRNVHAVCRANTARRRIDFRQGHRLGHDDRRVQWAKPTVRPSYFSEEFWAALPESLTLRLVRVRVAVPGFRTHSVILVTTLLDPTAYPPRALAQLYLRRWTLELSLRDLKSTLQMDHLSCKNPDNLERELRFHFLLHNLVRRLMLEAALRFNVPLERISFAGTLAAARRYAEAVLAARSAKQRRELTDALYRTLASDLVPWRPGRREPRAVKRRPKPYPLLNTPRKKYREIPHRNRYRAPIPSRKSTS